MEEIENLVKELEGEKLLENFSQMMAEQGELTDEEKEKTKTYFLNRVHSITSSIYDIVINGDEDEACDLLNNIWLETRVEWNRYNSQMQYQTFTQGQANPALMTKGACLSGIIEVIERHLDSASLYWVVKLASDPVEAVSYRLKQTKKFIEKTSQYGQISQNFIKNQVEILELLKKTNVEEEIINKVEKSIYQNIETINSSGALDLTDFSDGIEGAIVKAMKKSQLQFQVNNDQKNLERGISPYVANLIDDIVLNYVNQMTSDSLEKNSGEREGKSSFVNFDWEVSIEDDLIRFILKDDGLGRVQWKSEHNDFGNLKFDYTLVNDEKKGSTLTLIFSEYAVQNFLVFSLKDEGERYAIPATSTVQFIRNGVSPFLGDEGEPINWLKWPGVMEFPKKEVHHDIIFQNEKGEHFGVPCAQFHGFCQTKINSLPPKVMERHLYLGSLLQDDHDVKVLNTETLAGEFDADQREHKFLLRAG